MSGRAFIAQRDAEFAVKAPVKLVRDGEVIAAQTVHYFPTLEAALSFCSCCDYAWSYIGAPAFELKPPRGKA